MKAMIDWLKDNGLSLSMLILFVGFLFADSVAGLHSYNSEHASQGLAQIGYRRYLGTGAFLDGVFVNWQAAILQLTALIVFSEFLTQRGASHSRKPDNEARRSPGAKSDHRRRHAASDDGRTWWQATWLYRNSLALAFVLLFAVAFSLHVVCGANAYNDQRALLQQPPIGIAAYLVSSKLWGDTFQCWQAEFFAMWFFLVSSIYLRQEYSSESKALGAGVNDTGEPNE
jgi:hypothetical protein